MLGIQTQQGTGRGPGECAAVHAGLRVGSRPSLVLLALLGCLPGTCTSTFAQAAVLQPGAIPSLPPLLPSFIVVPPLEPGVSQATVSFLFAPQPSEEPLVL